MTNILPFPSTAVEDTLNDLLALINMGLWRIEASEPEEFAQAQSDFCTLFYMLRDKAQEGHKELTPIFRAEMRRGRRRKGQ